VADDGLIVGGVGERSVWSGRKVAQIIPRFKGCSGFTALLLFIGCRVAERRVFAPVIWGWVRVCFPKIQISFLDFHFGIVQIYFLMCFGIALWSP